MRRARTDKLKRLGLSAPKIKSIREIGKALAKGHIDLTRSATWTPTPHMPRSTALHGIGPWTADIYLLFCLGHADAFPAGDLAVQESARIAFELAQAAGRQGADQDRRGLAALARRGGASALGLLSRGEAARGHIASADKQETGAKDKKKTAAKKKSAKRKNRNG